MSPSAPKPRTLGNIVAPPRFVAYVGMLLLAVVAAMAQPERKLHAFLIGFDAATLLFLGSLIPLLWVREGKHIAAHAAANDANRPLLLLLAVALSSVVLAIVVAEVQSRGGAGTVPLALISLALAWISANVIFALHYAHLYYARGETGNDYAAGLAFPSTETPDYRDFLHFSLILGMTFQTADISITSGRIRWISTGHCLAAFVFNLGILAFSINILAS